MGNETTSTSVISDLKRLIQNETHPDKALYMSRAIDIIQEFESATKRVDTLYLEKCREVNELTVRLEKSIAVPFKVGDTLFRFMYLGGAPYKIQPFNVKSLVSLASIIESKQLGLSFFLDELDAINALAKIVAGKKEVSQEKANELELS